MGRMNEVLDELESIGAVGEKVVLLRLEPPKETVRLVLAPSERPAQAELVEQVRVLRAGCEEALRRLESIAKEVQDLQQVFSTAADLAALRVEGESDDA
jgi:hypothetical protein